MNLGEDLETEILLRLPAKPLMRFKCVQRSWNSLIKTPCFVSRRSKLQRNPSLLIIEQSKLKRPSIKLLSCDGDNEKPILIKSLFPKGVARIKTYGSCNGVFCLKGIYSGKTCHDQLIAWNPTTNEVHLIPSAPSLRNGAPSLRNGCIDKSFYGFGAVNGDFKLVKLNISDNNEMMKMIYLTSAEVYNLSTKSWTPILDFPPRIMVQHRQPSRYNTLVNGVYHWITSSYYTTKILCFDFHNNKFQQLEAPELPDATVFISYFRDDLIEIKGSLGYVVEYRNSSMVWLEIWIMEKNGWDKKYNFDTTQSKFRIYGIWNEGAEILGGNVEQRKLTSYDHQGNALRQFQIKISNFRIYEYVPSIALLSK